MAEQSEVPPLEDVPDVLKKLQERADQVVKENERHIQEEQSKKREDELLQKTSLQKSNFGGMKKGFLCGGGTSKTTKTIKVIQPKQTTEEMPFIQARPAKSDLELEKVRRALIKANLTGEFQHKLAKRLEAHTDVMDVLSDPAWLPLLSEFQDDPEAAMTKYKNNKKIKTTLLELCNVLGDTFLHMDTNKKTEEELSSGKLMEDPCVKEALTDPLVMKITKYMKQGANDKVERCINTASPDQRRHIQTLIDCGLLSFVM